MMLEDVPDYGASSVNYKAQEPLKLPPMFETTATRSVVSPRFEDLNGRSSAFAWSPAPQEDYTMKRPGDYLMSGRKNNRPGDVYPVNNMESKTSDFWSNSQNRGINSDFRSASIIQPQRAEPSSFSANNTFNRMNETTSYSQNHSEVPMIKSTEKKPATTSPSNERCSPRCKLGTLGFAIGLLAVAIPLAVILVLWLRQ